MLVSDLDAVVFDLDGVIVDTEVPIFEAWCKVFARHGCELTLEQWNTTVGSSGGAQMVYEQLMRNAEGPVADRETLRNEVRALQGDLFASMQPLPGVREWVHEALAVGLHLGVASSSSSVWVRRCLGAVGLTDEFTVVACPDSGLPAKPAPDLYLAACRGLDATPGRSLAIEDSRNGVATAVAAGLRCLAVPNTITAGADLGAAGLRIESLAALSLADAIALLAPA